jgi:hypothetical protein
MRVHVVFVVLIVFLLPFLVNAWKGYLMPSQDSEVFEVANDTVVGALAERLDDITRVLREQGDGLANATASQGKKGTRSLYRESDESLCAFIDQQVQKLSEQASSILGCATQCVDRPPCEQERYCWFFRMYESDGDFLTWHFDNNFTKGSRYTMVVTIYASPDNTSHFLTQDSKGGVRVHLTETGKGVLYDGCITKHAISRQSHGENRVVLVIPLYDDYSKTWFGHWRHWARGVSYKLLSL